MELCIKSSIADKSLGDRQGRSLENRPGGVGDEHSRIYGVSTPIGAPCVLRSLVTSILNISVQTTDKAYSGYTFPVITNKLTLTKGKQCSSLLTNSQRD